MIKQISIGIPKGIQCNSPHKYNCRYTALEQEQPYFNVDAEMCLNGSDDDDVCTKSSCHFRFGFHSQDSRGLDNSDLYLGKCFDYLSWSIQLTKMLLDWGMTSFLSKTKRHDKKQTVLLSLFKKTICLPWMISVLVLATLFVVSQLIIPHLNVSIQISQNLLSGLCRQFEKYFN